MPPSLPSKMAKLFPVDRFGAVSGKESGGNDESGELIAVPKVLGRLAHFYYRFKGLKSQAGSFGSGIKFCYDC
ncbi:MAG: hypothetical protein FJ146_15230 [Deltaproteobacteria bacterium]|nr:hypothetical protein [Deltaproteobacteria bacterium]